MACLDHVCVECEYAWMDNTRAYACPKCGGRVTNDFDEDLRDVEDDPDIHRPDGRDEDG